MLDIVGSFFGAQRAAPTAVEFLTLDGVARGRSLGAEIWIASVKMRDITTTIGPSSSGLDQSTGKFLRTARKCLRRRQCGFTPNRQQPERGQADAPQPPSQGNNRITISGNDWHPKALTPLPDRVCFSVGNGADGQRGSTMKTTTDAKTTTHTHTAICRSDGGREEWTVAPRGSELEHWWYTQDLLRAAGGDVIAIARRYADGGWKLTEWRRTPISLPA